MLHALNTSIYNLCLTEIVLKLIFYQYCLTKLYTASHPGLLSHFEHIMGSFIILQSEFF